jgi:transposase
MSDYHESSFLRTLAERKIFINLGAYDFRSGIDTLAAVSAATNSQEFSKGSLFVYCSRRRNQIRIVFWEGCGTWMITRKLSNGAYKWPNKNSDKSSVLSCYKDLINLLTDPVSQSEIKRREIVNRLSKQGK